MQTEQSPCWDADEFDIIHRDYTDTGERGINPLTGDTFQIWNCACGHHSFEVFPEN